MHGAFGGSSNISQQRHSCLSVFSVIWAHISDDQDIALPRKDLFDISRGVSALKSQEYLSSTKLSRYWELLPSSAACFVPAIPLLHEDISLLNLLAVEATKLRQKALVVARRGALENDIETALRQRWICIAEVTFPEKNRMSPQLYKVMSGLTV